MPLQKPYQIRKLFQQQKRAMNRAISDATSQLAAQSKYPAMSRADRRTVEYLRTRVEAEKSIQQDLKAQQRIVDRRYIVLQKLDKDIACIRQHLGNYNFENTTGTDSTTTTTTDSTTDPCACGDLSTDITTREAWKDQLTLLITLVKEYIEAQCLNTYFLLGSAELMATQFYNLFVVADPATWQTVLEAEFTKAVNSFNGQETTDWDSDTSAYISQDARVALIRSYLVTTSLLPQSLADALIIQEDLTTEIPSTLTDAVLQSDIDNALLHVPSIANIEDESDLGFIIDHMNEVAANVQNTYGEANTEKYRICFELETSETNQAFFQDEVNSMTAIDTAMLSSQRVLGKELIEELDILYRDNCFTKQTFSHHISSFNRC